MHRPCVCSETFSFVLTGEDGSRWFCYCRKILVSAVKLNICAWIMDSRARVFVCVMAAHHLLTQHLWGHVNHKPYHFWIDDRAHKEFVHFPSLLPHRETIRTLFKTPHFFIKFVWIWMFTVNFCCIFLIYFVSCLWHMTLCLYSSPVGRGRGFLRCTVLSASWAVSTCLRR